MSCNGVAGSERGINAESFPGLQIRDQIGEALRCQRGFESVGHQRCLRALQLHDVAAEDIVDGCVGELESDAAAGFAADDAVELLAIFQLAKNMR